MSNKKKVCALYIFFRFSYISNSFSFSGGLVKWVPSNLHKSSTSHQKRTAHSGWCVQHHRTYSLVTFSVFFFSFCSLRYFIIGGERKEKKMDKIGTFFVTRPGVFFFFSGENKRIAPINNSYTTMTGLHSYIRQKLNMAYRLYIFLFLKCAWIKRVWCSEANNQFFFYQNRFDFFDCRVLFGPFIRSEGDNSIYPIHIRCRPQAAAYNRL